MVVDVGGWRANNSPDVDLGHRTRERVIWWICDGATRLSVGAV
jgi:hypothetical protein